MCMSQSVCNFSCKYKVITDQNNHLHQQNKNTFPESDPEYIYIRQNE